MSGFTDIRGESWPIRTLPAAARPYAKLMRLDRPIGTWLLLLPGWWGIALAAGPTTGGLPDPALILLFGAGAIIMRGAGCVVNDLWDRDFDAAVERTRARPIPAGEVTVRQAVAFLAVLLTGGLLILLQLPPVAIGLGVVSLALVGTYPMMKRVTWWPQAFLGLTFNWGALMGWAAVDNGISLPPLLLYAAGFFWTLAYDTIYAYQDIEDDARIGVKSTARLFGADGWYLVAVSYAIFAFLAAASLWTAGTSIWALPGGLAALGVIAWILSAWRRGDQASCLRMFKANRLIGFLLFAAIVAGQAIEP